MATSEEYLASLGFDTSDVDKAVDQTITLLGHLGSQFDSVAGKAEKAATKLSGTGAASQAAASATKQQTAAEKARNQQLEISSKQTALYNQYLYDQERAVNGAGGGLARLRYAVYDVSNALGIGAVAAGAFVGGIIGANVIFEREFADVRRTVGVTGESADQLYDRFIRLSTEIPVAFASLAQIGTLAGQLGVAEDRVASFTETVAKFSATTDVSVDASATAFGRLDQLIDGVDGRYANLASSILNVGINSVATESQIIAIASQIAATGNQAGLTADEIIGLSGSLASLGVAPEAARGTVLRVFSQINSAVAIGGERLNDFASISRMSADEFRNGWGSDFTSTFLQFLEGVNTSGLGAETALRSLGITATRDVNAMLKLSQNADSVAANLNLAAVGLNNAGILTENFGIIADTNSARLQTLLQTVQAFAATVGEATSGPLAYFLDYLQKILTAFIGFSNTDLGQSISFFATILAGTVAVMLLIGAVTLRTAGTFLALKTAIGEIYLQTLLAQGGMRGFAASLFGAAGGAAALSAALKATGVGLVLTTGLYLLGEAIGGIGELMRSNADRAEEYFGTLDGLTEAVRADNLDVFAERLERANEAIMSSGEEGSSWIATLKGAAEAQAELRLETDGAGTAIDAQTLKIGTNTQEWLRNALAQSSAFQSIFANLDQLNRLTGSNTFTAGGMSVDYSAFNLEEFINIASTQGSTAAQAYYDSWELGLYEAFTASGGTTQNTAALVAEALGGDQTRAAVQEAGREIGNALTVGLEEAASSDVQSALLDSILGPLEESAEGAGTAFNSLVDDIYGVINAEAELSSNTQKLGADFATNGAQVASSGSAMQAVIASIYASSSGAPEAASRMQGLFNALIQGGYASASQLAGLQAIINSLAGGGKVKAAAFDMSAFATGIDKVGTAAGGGGGGGGAAAKVRTLIDYANDLKGVFSRAFDIRFSGGQAFDDISSGWLKISDAIAKTNLEIAKYQAEMQQLAADRAVREYWLSVAENYGDVLRAGELRAELADIDNELAKTSDDLTKAQAKNSKSLVGNSQAAIDNREEILGLVSGYQSYITSLAASGTSQADLATIAAQLKSEFLTQATQLGYNVAELGNYALAFDDVSTAIARVPRDITVAANVDPAIQALNELQAKITSINAGGGVNIPVTTTGYVDQGARDALFTQWATKAQQQYGMALAQSASGWAYVRQQWAAGAYGNPGFRKGTPWTGSGNPWEIAGVVHNREAVLNERGTQAVSSQFINAANQGRNPWAYAPSSGKQASFPKSMVVELSPLDRELVANGKPVVVTISPEAVGQSASSSFTDDSHRGGS